MWHELQRLHTLCMSGREAVCRGTKRCGQSGSAMAQHQGEGWRYCTSSFLRGASKGSPLERRARHTSSTPFSRIAAWLAFQHIEVASPCT